MTTATTTAKPTTTKPAAADAILAALAAHPGATAAELADHAGLGHSTASKALAMLEEHGQAVRTAGGREGGRRLPDRWAPAGRTAAGNSRSAKGRAPSGGWRLAKGALRAMVLDHLRRHRDQQLTPSAVARALGHSAGAVANALGRLAVDGDVREVSSVPRRYAVAD